MSGFAVQTLSRQAQKLDNRSAWMPLRECKARARMRRARSSSDCCSRLSVWSPCPCRRECAVQPLVQLCIFVGGHARFSSTWQRRSTHAAKQQKPHLIGLFSRASFINARDNVATSSLTFAQASGPVCLVARSGRRQRDVRSGHDTANDTCCLGPQLPPRAATQASIALQIPLARIPDYW